MASNCPICNAPAEFLAPSEYVPENTIVRCSNRFCVNNQQYAHIDDWQASANLLPCPICGIQVKVQPHYYSNDTVVGCENTPDCFTLIDSEPADVARKWNFIAASLNKSAG